MSEVVCNQRAVSCWEYRADLRRSLLAEYLGNDIDDDGAAQASAEKHVNQRILDCCHYDRHLCDRFHRRAPWCVSLETPRLRAEARASKIRKRRTKERFFG
jgi:hypothetical protein